MLSALPFIEREYYSHEHLVIDTVGKSRAAACQLESQYAFVAGAHREYLAYFHRADLPPSMWKWDLASRAKAFSGFAVTLKKDGVRQRKLLMQCSANY